MTTTQNENHIAIKPFFIAGLSCFLNSIMTVLIWKRGGYKRCFGNSWGFRYERDTDKTIGRCINAEIDKVVSNLREYYGVDFHFHPEVETKDRIEKIKEEIRVGNPVVIFCDPFYLEWQYGYRQHHGDHACLVTGFDENGFWCVDSTPICEKAFLPYDDFVEGSRNFVTFEFLPYDESELDCRKILQNALIKMNFGKDNSCFEQMRCFAQDFLSIDIRKELEGANTKWSVDLHKNIEKIYGGRVQFLEMLELLKAQNVDIDTETLIDRFNTLIVKWSMIRTFIFRLADNPGQQLIEKISKKLYDAAAYEEETARLMEGIALMGIQEKNAKEVENEETGKIQFIDLKKYFNSYSHYFEKLEEYTIDHEIPVGKEWEVSNMRFLFPTDCKGEPNSIDCGGGRVCIDMEEKRYSKLMFLTYGTWQDSVEDVQIIYNGREKQVIEMGFTDWIQPPHFGESVAWEGNYINKNNSRDVIHARIFGMSYDVDSQYPIQELILPENGYVHIFALSGVLAEG